MTQPPTPEAARLAEELRQACASIRRKPYPIAELVPLLQRAADSLGQSRPATDEASERERFEARFPVPVGVRWIGDGYECDERRENSYLCERFMARWIAWLAAKADMSTPAPKIDASAGCVDSVSVPAGFWLAPMEPDAWMIQQAMKLCGGIGGGSCGEHSGVDSDDMRSVYDTMRDSWLARNPPAESTDGLAKEPL